MSTRIHADRLHAVALTRAGAATARRLGAGIPGCRVWVPRRFAGEGGQGFEGPVAGLLARLWPEAKGFFLVMAAGIAVRAIAPLLRDKTRDPAVVVLDPAGRFAVPVLSGHLGGANDLAVRAAGALGGTPVITTATDAAGRPAVEVWARARGWAWEPREGVVRVNGAWADGEPVGLYVDPLAGDLGVEEALGEHLALVTGDEARARGFPGALVAVTPRLLPDLGAALFLRPPCLVLGVGCRRGAGPHAVEQGVRRALAEAGLSERAVRAVATADVKAAEPALVRLARSLGADLVSFPSGELSRVRVPTPSARVARAVGTPSVAEAAALLASRGRLLVPKRKGDVWTLAVAAAPAGAAGPG